MEPYFVVHGKLGTGKTYTNINAVLTKYIIEGKLHVADPSYYIDTIEALIQKTTKSVFTEKRGKF